MSISFISGIFFEFDVLHPMKKNKIIGTYYFNTERSSNTQILKRLDKVPGKWRTCEIKVPKGRHQYSIEIPDKDKAVLTRFILY